MLKNRLLGVIAVFVLMLGLGFVVQPELAFADEGVSVPYVEGTADATDMQDDTSAVAGLTGTMYKFATYLSGLIFGVSVIMIVWAGFKYATSQGEQKTMEQAKMQIITAGIGIGVALLAMVIVKVFAEIYNVGGTTED